MPQSRLIRFVRSPEGVITADLKGRLPGRGAYLCLNRDCIAAALARKQFDRAFRKPCRPTTVAQVAGEIAGESLAHLVGLLGMARKSARFLAGSSAVLEALSRPRALAVVILARDISPQIGDKVRHKAAVQQVLTTELLDKEELGRILGRAERSVVGLPDGKLAEAFKEELLRYQDISGEG